jgi:hypothetical protein
MMVPTAKREAAFSMLQAHTMAHLKIVRGCHTGQYIELDEELRLGRDADNDFAL